MLVKVYDLKNLSGRDVEALCTRNPVYDPELFDFCRDVFEEVKSRGDEAVAEYTLRYDHVELTECRVSAEEFISAAKMVSQELNSALELAARNIRKFHSSQQMTTIPVEVQEGVTCWRAARAIQSVGLYVPGGTAVLPSSVLMLGIPAVLAGCSKVAITVPPLKDGTVSPAVLAAARIAGVRQVFKVGGAQAIAALSLGTETVPRVDKILGPGNRFVQMAKLVATLQGTAIDMVAGPSEVLVIADNTADPRVIASDLLSQAEHDRDAQVVLVTTSKDLVEPVQEELKEQLSRLPRREIAEAALSRSFILMAETLEEAISFSNEYAPEHLILLFENAGEHSSQVRSAGSVFVGRWTPEVAGDYVSGTNHTLPTSGAARAFSGVSLDSYVKKLTFQEISEQGLSDLSGPLRLLAREEGLEGHANAVTTRLDLIRLGE
ncbi:MAG: histidinol dehydrogenase [Acidobacteriota bacterium]